MLQELQSARVDLYIDQGDSYYKVFTVKNSLGIVINLTGLSIECSVKRYYNTHKSYNMQASIVSAVEGKILLQMTEQDSRALYEDRYVYSVRLRDNTMAVTIMDGQILVTNTVLSTSEVPVTMGGVQTTLTIDTPNV